MTISLHGKALELAAADGPIRTEGHETLLDLIRWLGETRGEALSDHLLGEDTCFFLVNGRGVMATGGLSTPLTGDDVVDAIPLVGGG